MPGRGMHAAGAGLKSHIRREHHQRLTLHKGMAAFTILKLCRRKGRKNGIINGTLVCAKFRKHLLNKALGQNPDLVLDRDRGILEIRMKGNCKVCRQGPGGGCPDHGSNIFAGKFRHNIAKVVHDREFDVNRG